MLPTANFAVKGIAKPPNPESQNAKTGPRLSCKIEYLLTIASEFFTDDSERYLIANNANLGQIVSWLERQQFKQSLFDW
jgi:hypothetical protein